MRSRLLPALVAALLLLLSPAGGRMAERPATAATPRMNVVLILTDDQTIESVARMPYVGSRRDWVRFSSAWIENPLCCPSRATILTGQYDTHTGVLNNGLARRLREAQTLPVWLTAAGYRTGLFGKYLNDYPFGRGTPYVPPGWTDWQAVYQGVYKQYDYSLSDNGRRVQFGHAPGDYAVDVLADRAADFIGANAASPFFLYFAPTATHFPWHAGPGRSGMFARVQVPEPPSFNEPDVSDKPRYIRDQPLRSRTTYENNRRKEWAAAVSVDDAVRRIDGALAAHGLLDRTVLIFMTDNGYAFGEHRWPTKRCEYNECSHTPLLVRYPDRAGRTDSTHMISNVDIAPTVADIAGAATKVPQDGASFLPLLQGRSVPWRSGLLTHWSGGNALGTAGWLTSNPQWWGVQTTRYKYVELATGERELYDEQADPYELTNVVGDPGRASVVADMRSRLDTLRRAAGSAPDAGDRGVTVGPVPPRSQDADD